jgi:hypothetical protein
LQAALIQKEERREEARKAARKHGTLAALLALHLERLRSEDKHRYADKVERDIERNIPIGAPVCPDVASQWQQRADKRVASVGRKNKSHVSPM